MTGCMYPGQTLPDFISPTDYHVSCVDEYDVSTCELQFAARPDEESPALLCKMSLATGVTTPIIPQSNYILAGNVMFFKSGVVRAVCCVPQSSRVTCCVLRRGRRLGMTRSFWAA